MIYPRPTKFVWQSTYLWPVKVYRYDKCYAAISEYQWIHRPRQPGCTSLIYHASPLSAFHLIMFIIMFSANIITQMFTNITADPDHRLTMTSNDTLRGRHTRLAGETIKLLQRVKYLDRVGGNDTCTRPFIKHNKILITTLVSSLHCRIKRPPIIPQIFSVI